MSLFSKLRLSVRDVGVGIHAFIHLSTALTLLAIFEISVASGSYAVAVISALSFGIIVGCMGWAGAGHEFVHGTAFSKPYLNKLFLRFFVIFSFENITFFRISHNQHHAKTLDENEDIEVFYDWRAARKFRLPDVINLGLLLKKQKAVWMNAFGFFPKSIEKYPDSLRIKLEKKLTDIRKDAIFLLAPHFFVVLVLVMSQCFAAALLLFAGHVVMQWPVRLLAILQHGGMNYQSRDPMENARNMKLPRLVEFFYWNMNYHATHHKNPTIPYFELPLLTRKDNRINGRFADIKG